MMRAKPLMILRLACATSAAASSTSSFGKIKVLCLHGYSQNAAIFRDRSGGFRKPFKKNVFEMHYAEGPFGCTAKGEDPAIADADLTQRAWWRGHSGMETYDGWAETRANLAEVWREEQFDGIIGFSQGAAAAAMLAAELRPRFAIFVSGLSRATPMPPRAFLRVSKAYHPCTCTEAQMSWWSRSVRGRCPSCLRMRPF